MRNGESPNRLIIAARLRSGTERQAESLIALGPPFALDRFELTRHSVHLVERTVLFVFEGPGVEWVVTDIVNDPVLAASFGAWAPLLDGRPSIARELFAWERSRV
jgi:hypothetical protein